jgi:hypothetical protein
LQIAKCKLENDDCRQFAFCILQFAFCNSFRQRSVLLIGIAVCGALARADAPPDRPDLSTVKPIAACALRSLSASRQPTYERTAVLYSIQSPIDDPLANYERTPLGDWQMPAEADRNDPWLRLLVVAPKRPIVIDLAVFIDGKAFREKREVWIDEVVAAAKTQTSGDAPAGNNSEEAAGTNGAVTASEDGPPAGDEKKKPEDDAGKQPAGVATQARKSPTMRERLMNYLSTNGDVHREEVNWLIAEWGAGPAVVVLGPSLSWQRASLAPLLAHLDQDSDGALSAAEIGQAEGLLKRTDFDSNDVVDLSEIRRLTNRPLFSGRATGHALVVPLDSNTDWDSLAVNLKQAYGGRSAAPKVDLSSAAIKDRIAGGDPTVDGEQLRELSSGAADIALRVEFDSAKNEKQQADAVSVVSIGADLISSGEAAVATADAISFDVGGDFIEFSAGMAPVGENADISASQLAIGAVIDGNPIERLLDRDQDGRFTLRERQELSGLLAALDRNVDGQVGSDEIPVPIRLAVTLGPLVHQLLATPTGAVRTIAPRDAATAPPDWFLSMDKNNDRDLSRGEFLGTTEQFRQFDADGDGLLSAQEALKLGAGQ